MSRDMLSDERQSGVDDKQRMEHHRESTCIAMKIKAR